MMIPIREDFGIFSDIRHDFPLTQPHSFGSNPDREQRHDAITDRPANSLNRPF
jgi:hypothetical protein